MPRKSAPIPSTPRKSKAPAVHEDAAPYTVAAVPTKRHPPKPEPEGEAASSPPVVPAGKPSAVVDTRVVYCGDNLDQLRRLPAACVDLIYIDPPFNSNRNYEVFWGETKETRAVRFVDA